MANSAMFLIRVAAALVLAADALEEQHSPRHHGGHHGVKVHKSGVKVSIFYETLCPACLYFFSHEMKTLVDTHSIMDAAELEFVPYGNAVTNGGTVTCQHGIKECELNMLHACAIKNMPAKETPAWVQCAMGVGAVGNKQPKDVLDSCKASNADKIWSCYGGGSNQEAINLHLEHGKRTASAGQQYTPYMLLNDQHSKEAENDISRAICGAIQGTKPEGCRSLPNTLIRSQSTVTYRDDKTTLHKYSLPFTASKTEKSVNESVGQKNETISKPLQAAAVSASGAVDYPEDEEQAEEEEEEAPEDTALESVNETISAEDAEEAGKPGKKGGKKNKKKGGKKNKKKGGMKGMSGHGPME